MLIDSNNSVNYYFFIWLCQWYKNVSEDGKQKLFEYRKKYKVSKIRTASQMKDDWCSWLAAVDKTI